MSQDFAIAVDWMSANDGPAEIRETSGLVTIQFGESLATRSEDGWSKSVRPNVRVSAYPLALWFASSWWRLCWEPAFEGWRVNHAWRMAHECNAAGYGYLWPHVIFESDGEQVLANCLPSVPTIAEPIRYLDSFRASVSKKNFESTVDEFVSLVVARLDALDIRDTDLQLLWGDVKEERQDADSATHRRLEARLGYEPDEAPSSTVAKLIGLAPIAGIESVGEIAPACAGKNPEAMLDAIVAAAEVNELQGKVKHPPNIDPANYKVGLTWDRGRKLARDYRSALGINGGGLSDSDFSEILGIPEEALKSKPTVRQLPLGLAVRNGDADALRYVFRRKIRTGRRFEAARFLADSLWAPNEDHWLAETDARTARQKMQRAFAAEFLCPIDSLVNYLEEDYSSEAISEAGEKFGVSPLAVRSHLANTGHIHPVDVAVDSAS